jgi:chromosome segregation ATPase
LTTSSRGRARHVDCLVAVRRDDAIVVVRPGERMSDEKLEQVAGQVSDLQGKVDVLKGQVGDLQGNVGVLKGQVSELSERLDRVEQKVEGLEKRVERLELKFDRLEQKVDLLIEAFFAFRDEVRARFDALEERMDRVEDRLDALETRMTAVERRLDKVEVTLEEHGGHIRQLAEANAALQALIERRHQDAIEHFDMRMIPIELAIREHSAVVRYHNLTPGAGLH